MQTLQPASNRREKIQSNQFLKQLGKIKYYLKRQKCDDALCLLENLYTQNNIDVLLTEGITLEKSNRFEEAIRTFDQILSIEKKNVEVRYHRAFCLLNLGQLEEARSDLKSCLEAGLNADYIHALLALTYTVEGKPTDSITGWKRILPIFNNLQSIYHQNSADEKINPVNILKDLDIFSIYETKNISLSVVIPVKDEEGSLFLLYEKLKTVLDNLSKKYEIIFIDDGSTDRSLQILTDISLKDPSVVIIKFRRNYGQTAAFAAGFKYASGEVVVTMDADLQNDPSDIPDLLTKMAEGYDLVCGWRKNRHDKTFSRKFPSWIANRIINKLIAGTGIKIHDVGCSLKVYKKGIIKNIKLYGEMHRFIPAYAAWLGIKVAEIPVKHHPRHYGYSKYGLDRVGRVVLDLVTLRFYTGFKTRPFQFFGKIAATISTCGIGLSTMLLLAGKVFSLGINFQTFVLMTLFSIFGGLQFIVVGLLSEIIMRSFLESQDREEYVVENITNSSIYEDA
jgi:glycosyltransferase involved in cell wall biosynthesis